MLVSTAFAQEAAPAAAAPDAMLQFLPIVLIFVVFYFLLIRPQQKKMKQHKEMLGAVRRGDRIVTGGGIVGTVTKVVDDNEVQIEIADGVRVRMQRAMISAVMARTEPGGDTKPEDRSGGGAAGGAGSGTGAAGDGAAKSGGSPASRLTRILGVKRD